MLDVGQWGSMFNSFGCMLASKLGFFVMDVSVWPKSVFIFEI